MTDTTRGVTFTLKTDASPVKPGLDATKSALDEMGRSAQASSAKASAGLDGVGKSADKTAASVDKLSKSQDETARTGERMGLVLGAAITTLTAAYIGLTTKAISGLDDVYKSSQRLGTSTEFISTLGVAARQNDVSFTQLSGSLNIFSNSIARAAGGSKIQSQLFSEMGVSVRDASGNVKSLEQILPEVANAFATYKDGPEKAALANKLFGLSGSELIPLLNELGDKGFKAVQDAAAQMGLVIDHDTAKAAHNLNEQVTALKLTTEAYFNKVASDVLPNLILFAKGLNETATGATNANDKTTILGNGIRDIATWFIEGYGAAQKFGVGLGAAIDTGLVELEKAKAELTSPDYLNLVVSALTGNGQAIAALKVFNQQIDQQFSGKLRSIKDAADTSFADIDKTVATHVANINKNVHTMGDALDTAKPRTGNAPVADFARVGGTDKAANDLKSLENYVNSLAEKVGGPFAQAWQKYSDELDHVDDLVEKAKKDHADLATVANLEKVGYTNARNALGQHLNALQLAKEKTEAYVVSQKKLNDAIGGYMDSLGKEIDVEEARLEVGGELNASQETELFIKQNLVDASGKVKAGYEGEVDSLRKLAAQLDLVHAKEELQKTILGGINDLIEGTRQGVISGESAWQAFGKTAAQVLPKIADDFAKIIKNLEDANGGTVDFSKAIEGLGEGLEKALPALGQLAGTIAGGGGNGAVIGSGVGGIVGGIIGAYFGSPALGAAIGSFIGGVIGGQGDGGGTPAVYASSRPGSVGRDGTAPIQTPLGIIATDTDNLADDAYKQFETAVKGFDQQLAKLFSPEQLAAAQEALKGFSGKFSDINALLTARFQVILGTFDQSIQDFVTGFASDLQGQVQALADVLSLQKLEKAGKLITDNLADALTLITEFSQAGERVADTYARLVVSTDDYKQALALAGQQFDGTKTQLVEFAQHISDAVGSTQEADALWQSFFSHFYSTAELTAGNIKVLQQQANDSLNKIGLDSTISLDDFRKKFLAALPTLTPEQIANWLQGANALGQLNDAITSLVNQGEQLVDKLYGGGTLDSVNQQISTLEGQAGQSSTPLHSFGNAITSVAQKAKSAYDLLLGDLSPLNDQQKLQYALSGLRNGSVSQEQVLQIGRNLYASSQKYTDLFNMVRAIGDHTGSAGSQFNTGGGGTTQSHGTLTPADQQRLDDLYARRDTLQARQRQQEARDLATTVANLALVQHETFQQVADELGFKLGDLAKDLGLNTADLNTYLTNIQHSQTAIPDAVTANTDRQIKAMYDIAGKAVPPWALDHPDQQGPAAPIQDSRSHSGHARPGTPAGTADIPDLSTTHGNNVAVNSAINTQTVTFTTHLTRINDTLDRIAVISRDGFRSVVSESRNGRTGNSQGPVRRNARVPA